ncbi:hypothetical protein RJ639_024163 [Escallonia herrerae]|uniref:Uncharacterized protein n=1 Tax=Escallonia herrerae TaxID=1293975 RepID=A0AA88UYY9_9ASTE|nr:hypothetical protein RJ639_024163 [Escallonia herrerae]
MTFHWSLESGLIIDPLSRRKVLKREKINLLGFVSEQNSQVNIVCTAGEQNGYVSPYDKKLKQRQLFLLLCSSGLFPTLPSSGKTKSKNPYNEKRLLEQNKRIQRENNAPEDFPSFVREGFDVEVVASENYVKRDSGLMYQDFEVGNGDCPKAGQQVFLLPTFSFEAMVPLTNCGRKIYGLPIGFMELINHAMTKEFLHCHTLREGSPAAGCVTSPVRCPSLPLPSIANYTDWAHSRVPKDAITEAPQTDAQPPLAITSFEEGIGDMRPGGKRRIIIPPELGPPIGPSTFFSAKQFEVFDVELLDVQDCQRRTIGFYYDVVCN